MMQIIFREGSRSWSGTESRTPAGRRFGIVKHPGWQVITNPVTGQPMRVLPSAQQMQDRPIGDDKGAQIPVLPHMWEYIRKINDQRGYDYARSVGMLWINSKYSDTETPMATTTISGGNYFAGDVIENNHIRLLSFPYDIDTSLFSPQYHNWQQMPWMFWKCSGYDEAGNTYKVLDGVDCYLPRIARTELWLPLDKVQLFPVGPDYRFFGSNVYDGDSPLFTITNGVKKFHTDWRFTVNPVFK